MVWHALLQTTDVTLLALIPTTMDRIIVWGALALVVGLIAWREYTLPDVSPPTPAPEPERRPDTRSASEPGMATPLPGAAPANALLVAAEPRPTSAPTNR